MINENAPQPDQELQAVHTFIDKHIPDQELKNELKLKANDLIYLGLSRESEILTSLGLRTILSSKPLSERAEFTVSNLNKMDNLGYVLRSVEQGEYEQLEVQLLGLYSDAFQKLIDLSKGITPVVGVVGSFAQKRARFGVGTLGVNYEEAEENHMMASLENNLKPPSDIDVLVDPKTDEAALEKIDAIVSTLFAEYGVVIQVHATEPQKGTAIVSSTEVIQAGGLANWYSSEK